MFRKVMANQATRAAAWFGPCRSCCFRLFEPLLGLLFLVFLLCLFVHRRCSGFASPSVLNTVTSRLLPQHAEVLVCGALLLRLLLPPLCPAKSVDVLLSCRYLSMTHELLHCNDVTSPDVHLSGPRGPEVV